MRVKKYSVGNTIAVEFDVNEQRLGLFKGAAEGMVLELHEGLAEELLGQLLSLLNPSARHLSDCALHNLPALPTGPCDSGASAEPPPPPPEGRSRDH